MSVEQARIRTEERHRSYTDLVDSIAILAEVDPVAFRRIRANVDEIRRWFWDRAAWRVDLSHEMVRLDKRPAIASSHQGFSWCELPLDYELFVWLLWYEEVRDTHQFVCSELIRELEAQIAEAVGGDHFTWDSYDHRRALRRVIEEMTSVGAVRRLDGSIAAMVVDANEDALYEFTGVARRLQPILSDQVAAALETGLLAGAAKTTEMVTAEQRLYRSLLLSPALYVHQDPEAFAVVSGRDPRRRIREDLQARLGWDLEVTQTYACLLRPTGHGRVANIFPTRQAAIMHVVLLMCGHLREIAQTRRAEVDALDRIVMIRARFLAELIKVRREFGENWGKGLSEAEMSIEQLTDLTLSEMSAWGLVEQGEDPDTLRFLPLVGRFLGVYTDEPIAEDVLDEETD